MTLAQGVWGKISPRRPFGPLVEMTIGLLCVILSKAVNGRVEGSCPLRSLKVQGNYPPRRGRSFTAFRMTTEERETMGLGVILSKAVNGRVEGSPPSMNKGTI